jgi:hypothetical protein
MAWVGWAGHNQEKNPDGFLIFLLRLATNTLLPEQLQGLEQRQNVWSLFGKSPKSIKGLKEGWRHSGKFIKRSGEPLGGIPNIFPDVFISSVKMKKSTRKSCEPQEKRRTARPIIQRFSEYFSHFHPSRRIPKALIETLRSNGKTYQMFSPNYVLSNDTISSQIQAGATIPLRRQIGR